MIHTIDMPYIHHPMLDLMYEMGLVWEQTFVDVFQYWVPVDLFVPVMSAEGIE